MTRNGKIARLPKAVRDELNQRLEDGEPGPSLLAWLNGRDDVRAVLTAQFGGRPINKQNLSEWRLGGWKDSRRRQESLEMVRDLMEDAAGLREITEGRRLSDVIAEMAALALARQLRAADELPEGAEQVRATCKIIREVVRLRASDREYERAQRADEIHRMRLGRTRMADDRGRKTEYEAQRAKGGELMSWREVVGASQTESDLIAFRPAPELENTG
jgi:hypothetical protein